MAVSDTSLASSASMTTRADAGKGASGVVALWLQAIDLAGRQEEDWRKRAEECCSLYRGGEMNERARKRRFNILYANVETLAPATYNSLPIPDIRRRFNEADPVSKQASTILERCLSFSMEQEDFDGVLQRAVKDALLVGRAVSRVKYDATFSKAEAKADPLPPPDTGKGEEPKADDTPPSEEAKEPEDADVETEGTCSETVSWVDFRHGPAKVWRDVPWIAFRHFLTRAELKKLSPRNGERMDLDARVPGMDDKTDKDGTPPPDLFRRATVWEIWDRETREVLFIAPAFKEAPLKTMDDPLGLSGFYPIPKPIYALESPDDLTPVEPYRLYKDLATELDIITRRISALTAAMRWRGAYSDPNLGDFLSKFKDLSDGEMAPIENPAALMAGAGLDKAFWFMPLEPLVQVVTQLYAAREQVKQSIYEVTGIADIVRGATKATETATAQQLKSQWGNLRIQHLQAEVGRFARDLLRLQAEIVAEKFAPETLFSMSGVKLPAEAEVRAQVLQQKAQQAQQQPPQPGQQMSGNPAQLTPDEEAKLAETATQESVVKLLRDDTLRRFRIDIETDSTIRADVQRQQENAQGFVQGFAGFIQAVGPAVQEGTLPKPVAVEMLKSFARSFKLGRSVEDALEAMPAEQQPPPDPAAAAKAAEEAKQQGETQREQMKLQAEGQAQQAEMQARAAEAQMQGQMEQAKADQQAQGAQLQAQVALQSKEMELQAQMRIEQARMAAEDQRAAAALAWEREKFGIEVGLRQQEMQAQADLKRTEIAANAEAKRHATETGYQAKTEATAAAAKSKGAK